MRHMSNRMISILIVLLLVGSLPIAALAAPIPEEGRLGSITVTVRYDDKPVSGGALTLFRVGEVSENDGNYCFLPAGDFSECGLVFENIQSPELAESLASYARSQKLTGTAKLISKKGIVTFSGLEQGLYLLVQNTAAYGYSKLSAFLVSLPYLDGDEYIYDVTASAKSELEREPEPTEPPKTPTSPGGKLPQTGQLWWPVPVLICCGLLCIAIGLIRRRRTSDEE